MSTSRPRPKTEWMAFARHVEALGYHTLVMPDHFGARFALAPALVLAAEATSRLRVGSLVYDNDFRHPALLAQEVASIDLLTDGRFEFGLGAGWLKSEYDAAGIPFDGGGTRVERMAEALDVVKGLFTATPLTYEGRYYRLTGLTGSAKPRQQPHPPILIGGGGRRLLTLAANEADIISIMPRSKRDGSGLEDADAGPEAFTRKVAWIREAAGDRFATIELNTLVQTVVITDHPRAAAEPLAKEYEMDPEQVFETPLVLIGSVDQIAQTLEQRRERFGLSYITVFEKDLENLAKVIGRSRS
ncbi:MAG TPA: TIGR03621 family F420-dependent LLM class oxidoreductase [Candidatus Dormibacteraeota bacterium]